MVDFIRCLVNLTSSGPAERKITINLLWGHLSFEGVGVGGVEDFKKYSTLQQLKKFMLDILYIMHRFSTGNNICLVCQCGKKVLALIKSSNIHTPPPPNVYIGKCHLSCVIVIIIKAHANGRNKCQQLPTLLRVVGQQCCVRLHGPKSLTGFKLYATSANKCQQVPTLLWFHANGRNSHNIVGPNNVGSVCMGLK